MDFAGAKAVNEVDVYTVRDDYGAQTEPTAADTFTLYGASDYAVEYWTGAAWAPLPGASVSGNNLVWRKFTFAPVTTSALRVVVTGGAGGVARITEVEAYEAVGAGAQADVRWLVSDHLGTPRMTADVTGSLTGIRRHDYLPFGEEIGAGIGGRTTGQGYVQDNVAQKFTGQIRDGETGLDYFGARYYASTQGRFTSPDVFWKDSQVSDPQSWNKYVYVRNNPLRYIDPSGEKATVRIETDEKNKKGTIKIVASIAIWTKDKNISKDALAKASADIKTSIENAWKGQYEQKDIKFDVSADITVTVHGSESEAAKSGAQNVVEMFKDKPGEQSDAGRLRLFSGQDGGRWGINAVGIGIAAHEFTHLLGVSNHNDGPYLSNTIYNHGTTATAYDYGWAFGGAINSHRSESRPYVSSGFELETRSSRGFGRGKEANHTSERVLRAPNTRWFYR